MAGVADAPEERVLSKTMHADDKDQIALAPVPAYNSWSMSATLLDFHLKSSDSAGIGGDLTYQNVSSISITPEQALLATPQFGLSHQNLQTARQDSSARML